MASVVDPKTCESRSAGDVHIKLVPNRPSSRERKKPQTFYDFALTGEKYAKKKNFKRATQCFAKSLKLDCEDKFAVLAVRSEVA